MNEKSELIDSIIGYLTHAGRLIMEVYNAGENASQVEFKPDNSPLTLADKRSHDFLTGRLNQLDSSIPVMSEESEETAYAVRKDWKRYWCLDPLDGTKEFIKRNGQFTINLALIENAMPVLGFIHVPITGQTYWAKKQQGAYLHDSKESSLIRVNSKSSDWIAVGSSSHGMEWDTSAGHLIVEEAGATFSYMSDNEIHYNKPSLLNPSFCVRIPL